MAELVTGHANKAHATAEQAAGLNAGILGLDDYVLNVHDKFKITVVSANKVTIGTGELVMQGRHVSQGTPEDLIVTNGSQGQKRNDLIVCRYAKGSQSIESAKLVVVRGTPTTGTPHRSSSIPNPGRRMEASPRNLLTTSPRTRRRSSGSSSCMVP